MPQADRIILRSSPSEDATPESGMLLGHALAMDHRLVVVGSDLMRTSTMMKEALVSGLLSSGADVIDVGEVSCPALAVAAAEGDCAVYVTEYRAYGMTSGYLLMNPDGGLFRRDQIRHLDKILVYPPELPDYRGIGRIRRRGGAEGRYMGRLREVLPEKAECSLAVDCCCGPVAGSAPQILNSMGADVISLNAQRDIGYISGEMDRHGISAEGVRTLQGLGSGFVGFVMNKIGTMAAVIDEGGRLLTPEQVFVLTVLFERPRRIAVPIDTTALVEDAFRGRLSGDDIPETDEDGLVMTDMGIGSVCAAVAEGADMGFYDGGIVYGNMCLTPDGIHTAATVAGIAGCLSISRIVNGFPEYLRETRTVECQTSPEAFRRAVAEALRDMDGRATVRTDAWRLDMDGGWFLVRLLRGQTPSVEITAESRDRAYLVGLMEIAGDLVAGCMRSQ